MDTRTTLLTALPLVLIITTLAAVIIFSNSKFTFDIRPKASEPTPALQKVNPFQLQSATVCSDLYQPVCGTDNQTYESICDAAAHSVSIAYYSACSNFNPATSPTPTTKPLPAGRQVPSGY